MVLAIGLMSGTSLDGVDAALLETDGQAIARPLGGLTLPYDPAFRAELRKAIAGKIGPKALEAPLTAFHADAVRKLLAKLGRVPSDIAVIGFHGQTVLHRPDQGRTWQIGDGQWLATRTGIPVAFDFRSADVAAGGEGAPLAPVYHLAIAADVVARPLAILNIGGVANITWIGRTDELVACDTGPGNGPLDDWVQAHTNQLCDTNGALARTGSPDQRRIAKALSSPFFSDPAPKSLDRLDFTHAIAAGLTPADGAATLTAITVSAIASSLAILPEAPARWLVTGGGRHNTWMMELLQSRLSAPVQPIEAIGRNGDDLEAEAFAYLAVRAMAGLPISFPGTTRAPKPLTGGRIAAPASGNKGAVTKGTD